MTTMTLYSGPLSMFGAKAQIAALEKGLPITVVMVPFTEDHRYDPRHPEVLRINPKYSLEVLRQITPFKDPAESERMFAALRKAGLK